MVQERSKTILIVRRVLAAICLTLWVFTPYILISYVEGLGWSSLYALVGVGIAVATSAVLVAKSFMPASRRHDADEPASCIAIALTLAGVLASLLVCVPEWMLAAQYLIEGSAIMTGSSIVGTLYEVALQWEPALVLLGSACTTAGLLLVEAPDGALDTSRDHQEGMSGSDSVTGVLQTRILTGDGASTTFALVQNLAFYGCCALVCVMSRMVWLAADGPLQGETGHLAMVAAALVLLAVALIAGRPKHINVSLACAWASFGLCSWSALSRVTPVGELAELLLLPTLLFGGVCVLIMLLGRRKKKPGVRADAEGPEGSCEGGVPAASDCSTSVSDTHPHVPLPVQQVWQRYAQRFDLAPREFEIGALIVQGATSREVGEKLNIKPSTVRATMQRVYKKCGVANRDALLEAIGIDGPQGDFDISPEPDAFGGRIQESVKASGEVGSWLYRTSRVGVSPLTSISRGVSIELVLVVAISCLLLWPWSLVAPCWGLGFEIPLGFGLGLVLFGLVAAAFAIHDVPSTLCNSRWSLWVTRSAWIITAAGFFTTSWGIVRVPAEGAHVGDSLALLSWMAVFAMATAMNLARLLRGASVHGALDVPSRGVGFVCSAVFISFLLGFAFEDAWRTVSGFSFVEISGALCLVLAGVTAWVLLRSVREDRRIIIGVAIIVVGAFALLARGLPVAVLFASIVAISYGAVSFLPIFAISCGAGCLSGFYITSVVSDGIWARNAGLTALFSGDVAFGVVAHIEIGTVFAAGVLVALLAVKSVMSTIRWQSSVASNKDAERRVRGFLVSKGLTDTQVAVLIALAEGMSDRQVADRLGYARGTVNTARTMGYAALGVHSRSALVSMLLQVTRL